MGFLYLIFGWPFALLTLMALRGMWAASMVLESNVMGTPPVNKAKIFPFGIFIISGLYAAVAAGLRCFIAYSVYMLSLPSMIGRVLLVLEIIKHLVLLVFSLSVPVIYFKMNFSTPRRAITLDSSVLNILMVWMIVSFLDVLHSLVVPGPIMTEMLTSVDTWAALFWFQCFHEIITMKNAVDRAILCEDYKFADQANGAFRWALLLVGRVAAVFFTCIVLFQSAISKLSSTVPGGFLVMLKNSLVFLLCMGYLIGSNSMRQCQFRRLLGMEGDLLLLLPLVALIITAFITLAPTGAAFLAINFVGSVAVLYFGIPMFRFHRVLLLLAALIDIITVWASVKNALLGYLVLQLTVGCIDFHQHVLLVALATGSGRAGTAQSVQLGEATSLLPFFKK